MATEMARPADGTENIRRLPHVDEAHGDLLRTGLGCPTARAARPGSGSA